MKSLYESLLDDEDVLVQKADKKLAKHKKDEILKWLKENTHKYGGRWKVNSKTFEVSAIDCKSLRIKKDLPDFIKFDELHCAEFTAEQLSKPIHVNASNIDGIIMFDCEGWDSMKEILEKNSNKHLYRVYLHKCKVQDLSVLKTYTLEKLQLNQTEINNFNGCDNVKDLLASQCSIKSFEGLSNVGTIVFDCGNVKSFKGLNSANIDKTIIKGETSDIDSLKGLNRKSKNYLYFYDVDLRKFNSEEIVVPDNFKEDKKYLDNFKLICRLVYDFNKPKVIDKIAKKVNSLEPGNTYILSSDISSFMEDNLSNISTDKGSSICVLMDYMDENNIKCWSCGLNTIETPCIKYNEPSYDKLKKVNRDTIYSIDRKHMNEIIEILKDLEKWHVY